MRGRHGIEYGGRYSASVQGAQDGFGYWWLVMDGPISVARVPIPAPETVM